MKNTFFSLMGAFFLALFILTLATRSWGDPSKAPFKGTLHGTNSVDRYLAVNVLDGTSLGSIFYARSRLGKTYYGFRYGRQGRGRKNYRSHSYAYRYKHAVPRGKYYGHSYDYRGYKKHRKVYKPGLSRF